MVDNYQKMHNPINAEHVKTYDFHFDQNDFKEKPLEGNLVYQDIPTKEEIKEFIEYCSTEISKANSSDLFFDAIKKIRDCAIKSNKTQIFMDEGLLYGQSGLLEEGGIKAKYTELKAQMDANLQKIKEIFDDKIKDKEILYNENTWSSVVDLLIGNIFYNLNHNADVKQHYKFLFNKHEKGELIMLPDKSLPEEAETIASKLENNQALNDREKWQLGILLSSLIGLESELKNKTMVIEFLRQGFNYFNDSSKFDLTKSMRLQVKNSWARYTGKVFFATKDDTNSFFDKVLHDCNISDNEFIHTIDINQINSSTHKNNGLINKAVLCKSNEGHHDFVLIPTFVDGNLEFILCDSVDQKTNELNYEGKSNQIRVAMLKIIKALVQKGSINSDPLSLSTCNIHVKLTHIGINKPNIIEQNVCRIGNSILGDEICEQLQNGELNINKKIYSKKEEITSYFINKKYKKFESILNSAQQQIQPQSQNLKQYFDRKYDNRSEDFKDILMQLKQETNLSAEEVINVFETAYNNKGYTNLPSGKVIKPPPSQRKRRFSVMFQKLSKEKNIKTTNKNATNKDVGLRTKRFVEMFSGVNNDEKMRNLQSFVREIWSDQEIQINK